MWICVLLLPLISAGAFEYPKDKALKVAISVIRDFLLSNEMMIYLVIYNKADFILSENLLSSIKEYIDDKYVEEYPIDLYDRFEERYMVKEYSVEDSMFSSTEGPVPVEKNKRSLQDVLKEMDETFSQR